MSSVAAYRAHMERMLGTLDESDRKDVLAAMDLIREVVAMHTMAGHVAISMVQMEILEADEARNAAQP